MNTQAFKFIILIYFGSHSIQAQHNSRIRIQAHKVAQGIVVQHCSTLHTPALFQLQKIVYLQL